MSVMNVALSGLNAASGDLEVTGNNIANANTTGFKQSRTEFSDVFGGGSAGNQIGNGVRISSVSQNFQPGPANPTGGQLDMAINGDGFFTIKQPDGTIAYTRAGSFTHDADGYITTKSGARVQGYTANNGQVGATVGDIRIPTEPVPPNPTNAVTFSRNLDSSSEIISATFDPTDSTTFNMTDSTTIYDSLGSQHDLSTYYVKTSDNNWDVQVEIDGANVATGSLAFGDDGQLQSATGLDNIVWNPGGGAAAGQTISLAMGAVSQYGGSGSKPAVSQDGYASGIYTNLSISGDGVISANYSNGRVDPIGQVAITEFNNPQGLYSMGDMTWIETESSGGPKTSKLNSLGNIQAGFLESSNVDLTEQLVNMITSQRAFQANAQSIKAGDTLMQTIINIA